MLCVSTTPDAAQWNVGIIQDTILSVLHVFLVHFHSSSSVAIKFGCLTVLLPCQMFLHAVMRHMSVGAA